MIDTTKTEIYDDETTADVVRHSIETAPTEVVDQTKTKLMTSVAAIKKRITKEPKTDVVVPIKHIRLVCLALALAGIPLLYVAAAVSEPEPVDIVDIGGSMRSAYVQITGTIVREPRIIQLAQGIGEITFFIDDGSGAIAVKAFKSVARDMVLAGKVPRLGELVEVSGTIDTDKFGDFSLVLLKTDSIKVLKNDLPQKSLAQIRQEAFRGAVRGQVKVVAVKPPPNNSNRPWRFTVEDGTATVDLIIWNTMLEPVLPLPWGAGAVLKGRFVVGAFKGAPQLSLSAITDIVIETPGAEIKANFTKAASPEKNR